MIFSVFANIYLQNAIVYVTDCRVNCKYDFEKGFYTYVHFIATCR